MNKDTMDCIMHLTKIFQKCTPLEAEQDSLHNTQEILDEFNKASQLIQNKELEKKEAVKFRDSNSW